MFGDNLSIISDTTIASTRTQEVGMKAKFWENMKFALPAVIVTTLVFGFLATDSAPITPEAFSWAATIPYVAILVLAVVGMNVFVVLLLGIVMAALQGAVFTGYELSTLGTDIAEGFANMQGIFILAMFVGSLGEFIKQQGGLQWISEHVNGMAEKVSRTGNRAQQMAIGILVFITDFCIANNVVSIVVTGDLSRNLAKKHNISCKRSATVLDTFACIAQGFLPYGNQALLLSGTFAISPWEAVSHNYFGMILLFVTVTIIVLGKESKKS